MPRAATVTPRLAVAGQASLASLPGVGPKVAEKFAARGISTLQDLWLHLPLRYEDRTRLTTIAQLQSGVPAQIEGRVDAVERGFRYRPVLRVAVSDESHGSVVLRFFHFRAAQVAQFAPGTRLRVFGTPKPGQNGWEIVHPSYRVLAPGEDAGLGDSLIRSIRYWKVLARPRCASSSARRWSACRPRPRWNCCRRTGCRTNNCPRCAPRC